MNNDIRHSGVVESVEDGCVSVRILQASACAACKVAAHCNAAEAKEKVVEVRTSGRMPQYSVGDAVTVCTTRRVATRAVIIGFVLPFLLMVLTLLAVMLLVHDEALAGLLSLAVLLPYYIIVWLLRNRIGREVSFYIE